MALNAIIAYILAYLTGSIPTSILTCRALKGIDIRKFGSGNAGATNVYRIMGLKVALFVLAVDALKGVAGVFLPQWLMADPGIWSIMAGGLVAILGHVFTVFAGFKGGKGVGTALGVFLALMPLPALIAFGVWVAVLAITRIVSAASMASGVALCLATFLLARYPMPLIWFSVLVAALIFITHRANISRLLKGTENKIKFSGKSKEQGA